MGGKADQRLAGHARADQAQRLRSELEQDGRGHCGGRRRGHDLDLMSKRTRRPNEQWGRGPLRAAVAP